MTIEKRKRVKAPTASGYYYARLKTVGGNPVPVRVIRDRHFGLKVRMTYTWQDINDFIWYGKVQQVEEE